MAKFVHEKQQERMTRKIPTGHVKSVHPEPKPDCLDVQNTSIPSIDFQNHPSHKTSPFTKAKFVAPASDCRFAKFEPTSSS